MCLVDSDCSDAVNGSVCVSGKCSCVDGFHGKDNVCRRLALGKCSVVTNMITSLYDTGNGPWNFYFFMQSLKTVGLISTIWKPVQLHFTYH